MFNLKKFVEKESLETLECFWKLILWVRKWVSEGIYMCEWKEQDCLKITLKKETWMESHDVWIDTISVTMKNLKTMTIDTKVKNFESIQNIIRWRMNRLKTAQTKIWTESCIQDNDWYDSKNFDTIQQLEVKNLRNWMNRIKILLNRFKTLKPNTR